MGMCAVATRIDAARSGERSLHVWSARSAAAVTTARAIFMVPTSAYLGRYTVPKYRFYTPNPPMFERYFSNRCWRSFSTSRAPPSLSSELIRNQVGLVQRGVLKSMFADHVAVSIGILPPQPCQIDRARLRFEIRVEKK